MSYSISYKKATFFVFFKDKVNINDMYNASIAVHAHEEFTGHKNQIWNFDSAQINLAPQPGLDFEEIAALDWAASLSAHKIKAACVGINEDVSSLLNQYLDVALKLGLQWEIKYFKNQESALKWMNLL